MRGRTIALLTDFSLKDPFVSMMKAVIKSINPNVEIIDISHDVRKFDIYEAAFILYGSHKYFPQDTIFLVVVDPGVGTGRRVLAVKTERHIFIAPDNGVLYPIIEEYNNSVTIYVIDEDKIAFTPKSSTFHGRDVFAPLAAYISLGYPLTYLGRVTTSNSIVKLKWIKPIVKDGVVLGQIAYIDSFGNVITNIPVNIVPWIKTCKLLRVKVEGRVEEVTARYVRTFANGKPGELIALEDSFGLLEIAVYEDSAAKMLKVDRGLKIKVQKGE